MFCIFISTPSIPKYLLPLTFYTNFDHSSYSKKNKVIKKIKYNIIYYMM
jgi:hypothetical protein